jgi:hypothetical protein
VELPQILLSRDFRRCSIFDFCNKIGTFRKWRDVWRESGLRVKPDISGAGPSASIPALRISVRIVDAIGAAQKFGGFLDQAAGFDRGLEIVDIAAHFAPHHELHAVALASSKVRAPTCGRASQTLRG